MTRMTDEQCSETMAEYEGEAKRLTLEQAFNILGRSIEELCDYGMDWRFTGDDAAAALCLMNTVVAQKKRIEVCEQALATIFHPYERMWVTPEDLVQRNLDIIEAVRQAHTHLPAPEGIA